MTADVEIAGPFDGLLAAFHPDRERAGAHYRALHHRLTKYFEWNGSADAAELADETIDRVVRKIAAGECIANPEAYAIGVARLLVLERKKEREREEEARQQFRWVAELPAAEEIAGAERRHECLDKALAALSPTSREIILTYYSGDGREKIERRRRLAESLGTDLNALRVRAHRIRAQLEGWVARCVAAPMP